MKQYNCSIRIHSRYHLELKSEYPLSKDSKTIGYKTDVYFFFPSQLSITEKRIGIKRFVNNIRIYTRFSTPGLSLKNLVDGNFKPNPLVRIRQFLEIAEFEQPRKKDIILYELQVLTNVYRAEVDNTVELVGNEIQKHNRGNMCYGRIQLFIEEIQSFLKEFRKLHALLMHPRISDIQREALAWADESISIITERALNKLFTYTQELESSEKLLMAFEKISKEETEYRCTMGYHYLYIDEDSRSGERLAYRESVLKKWSQSALYMNLEDSRTPRRIGHMLAGAAAGVAMIFALLVTIFAGKFFIPNSTPWILLIVLSYIFKDRIKELLREIFKNMLPRLTADQISILFDPAVDKRVGISRGYASFGKASSTPDNILKTRFRQPNPFRSILPEQDMIHYQRTIRLNSKKLTDNHSRLNSVTEIVRLHIADWLREMDDPKDIFYRLEGLKKIKIKGNRVYNIHLVMSLKNTGDPDFEELYHYRVVINKTGILRVETLEEVS